MTFLHRLLALAREGWHQRPRSQPFDARAAALRTQALGLAQDCAASGDGEHARAELDTYVKLAQVAQSSPRDAVWDGWNEVERLLDDAARRHGVPPRGGVRPLLDALEARKLLDFQAYALLRDLHAFHVDTTASPPEAIGLSTAQDHAVAVRSAQRVLLRVTTCPATA